MTKSFVTIFVIIMMAMALTLIRAHPAHSFAIWMLTCKQDNSTADAILMNVVPDPGLGDVCEEGESKCAECANAILIGSSKGHILPFIQFTTTQQLDGKILTQILIGL